MKTFNEVYRDWKIRVMKKYFPMRAVALHTLKSAGEEAYLYLPGKDFELKAINELAVGEFAQREFIAARVWSTETRHLLFEAEKWFLFDVRDCWELEYLLTKTKPVIYTSEALYQRGDSYKIIMRALKSDETYVRFLAEKYPEMVRVLGVKSLAAELCEESFVVLTKALTVSKSELAVLCVAEISVQTRAFEETVYWALEERCDVCVLLPKLYFERRDLWTYLRDVTAADPDGVTLQAVMLFLCDVVRGRMRTEKETAEFQDWLSIVKQYAEAKGGGLSFLEEVRDKLLCQGDVMLLPEVEWLMRRYTPGLLEPMRRR